MRNKIWINADYIEEFDSFEELEYWVEKKKHDRMAHYYFGAAENFDGELYTIDSIKSEMEEFWFREEVLPVEIFVFNKEEVRRESQRVSRARYREKKMIQAQENAIKE